MARFWHKLWHKPWRRYCHGHGESGGKAMGKVITISAHAPEKALEQLRRLTGLDFESHPESLLDAPVSNGDADHIRRQALGLPEAPQPHTSTPATSRRAR